MKKFAALFAIAVIVTGISAGQYSETRDLKGFDRIGFGIPGNLTIEIGPRFSVVLEGDKHDVEEVVTDISKGMLIIKHLNWRFRSDDNVNIRITMPELAGLNVSGSGKAEIINDISSDQLNLSVSGSGKLLTAGIDTDNLDCSISGSGDIIIGSGGEAGEAEISISGSGNYKGEEFEIDQLTARVSGSGSCYCRVGTSLKASVSGSGNITYKGDPHIDARVSGSGKVRSAS